MNATARTPRSTASRLMLAQCISLVIAGHAHAQSGVDDAADDARLDRLEQLLREQSESMEQLRDTLRRQEDEITALRQELADEQLDDLRAQGGDSDAWPGVPMPTQQGGGVSLPPLAGAAAAAVAAAQAQAGQSEAPRVEPVGQAPEELSRPPEVAQIFQQPGVLTPKGGFVLEPSVQYGYSATDRVALVGYTIIPAILIGLIDVRQVKTTTVVTSLTARYGLTNRFELEARVPYVNVTSDTISREIFTGTAVDSVFNSRGSGIGDVEVTARYQINTPDPDRPFYVGWLRYKSRTGKDLFEVTTDCVTRCVANATGTGLPLELPTGSGFEAVQTGLTWLLPSDPVVFFGSVSYLHNMPRKNVSRTVLGGEREFIGEVKAGDIIGLNVGMGLALNEKASISIGYDQNIVGETKQNGVDSPGSVRTTLGTLLLGGTYRLGPKSYLNLALGVGATRDAQDSSLTLRYSRAF
ncbi:acetate kinase [Cognatilysobacter tabacisoli]|uniref:acetate kinase n=1 Tax=Cognatilysobacter tabacisoli TaxID=2315424 RepID=UPI000E6B3C25|nr:acetate kinase [Lysobacter tabacisoli]